MGEHVGFYDNDGVPIEGEALDGILAALDVPWCEGCQRTRRDCTCGPVEIAARAMYDTPTPSDHELADLHTALEAVVAAGWRIVRPAKTDPHYVVFKDDGWEIEHSAACRNAGSMLDCDLHGFLTDFCVGPPPEGLGRYIAEFVEADDRWDVVPVGSEPGATALLCVEEWAPPDPRPAAPAGGEEEIDAG